MIFNTEYINAIIEIHSIQAAYLNGRELPPVAKRLIEIGKEKGVEIEITYGINCENENIIAGYWITAPQKNKQIFKQDIYVDDETEDNIRAAEKWMYHVLKELKRL
jgi:hypothetical protein